MEEVQKYYRQKAQIEVKDQYYDSIMQGDLDILRKSFVYVVVSPFLAIMVMYLAKEIKREYSMSERVQNQARNFQSMIVARSSGYRRSSSQQATTEPEPKEVLKAEQENLKSLYDSIKEDENAERTLKSQEMKTYNESVKSAKPRLKNASPFYKN